MSELESSEQKEELEGSLSKEQVEKATKWINEKLVDSLTCPTCKKTSKWTVEDVRIDLSSASIQAKWTIPAFCLICTNCGHILLHGAIRAGLIKPGVEDDTTRS